MNEQSQTRKRPLSGDAIIIDGGERRVVPIRQAPSYRRGKRPVVPIRPAPSYRRLYRLPQSILLDKGKLQVRREADRANLYIYRYGNPVENDNARSVGTLAENESGQTLVGSMIFQGNYSDEHWRQYDGVVFDSKKGCHYLKIRLTNAECIEFDEYEPDTMPTHGYAMLENTSKDCAKGKSSLEPRFLFYRKPVVLISLFDGIGGARVALDKLPDNYSVVASFASEKDEIAKAVVKRYDPTTKELPDVQHIDSAAVTRLIFGNPKVREAMDCTHFDDELMFLVFAGPPCQDLSQANADKYGHVKGALEGERSRLFFHIPRLLKLICNHVNISRVHYVVENVEMTEQNNRIFSEFLGRIKPFRVDFNNGGCCASLMSRRRLYWCSVMPSGGDIGFHDFNETGCIHPARVQGKTVNDVLSKLGYPEWEFHNVLKDGRIHNTLTRRDFQGGQQMYQIKRKDGTGEFRDAPQIINEDLLGFPLNHTLYGPGNELLSEGARRLLLGNTFCVFHVQYILKTMHGHICNPMVLEQFGGKMPGFLPQELCRVKLEQENLSRSDRKFYGDIKHVVTEILQFDEYEKSSRGKILNYLK